jgi:hypothetical protein
MNRTTGDDLEKTNAVDDAKDVVITPDLLSSRINRALTVIQTHRQDKPAEPLPDVDRVVAGLERARSQLAGVGIHPLGAQVGVDALEDYELALVRSALEVEPEPVERARAMERSIVGFKQYEDLDGNWLATLWHRLTNSKLPFPVAPTAQEQVFTIGDKATIAIAGDWGTGNASSMSIKEAIERRNPDYTIHLGDVYYSGTEAEERSKFVTPWPAGKQGSLALNSNHEMYGGGHGYFGVALTDPKFRLQCKHSYFALTNSNWLIIGLDSAYAATSFYDCGAISDPQLSWMHSILTSPVAKRLDGTRKRLILLTHHQGLEDDGKPCEPVWSQVVGAIRGFSAAWYWGHIHNVAVFKDVPYPVGSVPPEGVIKPRLVGHGGVPYAADKKTDAMDWTESGPFGDRQIPERAANGFAWLELVDRALNEAFFNETGAGRWRTTWE